MPELPEVETIRRDLIAAGLPGMTIRQADIYWHRTLAVPEESEFKRQITGAKIKGLSRRGKYLIFNLDRGDLVIHLRMSGRVDLEPAGYELRIHDRARLIFDDGRQLLFHDTRKFGRWYFADDAEKIVGKLGIEPLDKNFTARWLSEKLRGKKRMLKPLLLDQTLIAGIGNIYADEALWHAHLSPRMNSAKLKPEQIEALHDGIVYAIKTGIKNRGTSLGEGKANFYSVGKRNGENQDDLRVYQRAGEACERCETKIERIIVGQRGTHICPACQPHRFRSARNAAKLRKRRKHV